jgi:hypothetical protein
MSNIQLSKTGEVADYFSVTQIELENGVLESQFECGPFAVAEQRYAGYPTHGPDVNYEDYDTWADNLYTKYDGPNASWDTQGTTVDGLHSMILDSGLHYQDIDAISPNSTRSSDAQHVRAALAQGYPLIVTVVESSVFDMEIGGIPYNWVPPQSKATHIICLTGIAPDGENYLTRDSINIEGDVAGVNTVRPGPRTYDCTKLDITFATVIWHNWLPMIPAGFDFTQGVLNPMPIMNKAGSDAQQAQAKATWSLASCNKDDKGNDIPGTGNQVGYDSGIANIWQHLFYSGKNFGFPIRPEDKMQNWSKQDILVRWFVNGRIEWFQNAGRAFDALGNEINLYS